MLEEVERSIGGVAADAERNEVPVLSVALFGGLKYLRMSERGGMEEIESLSSYSVWLL